ncbi:MAG: hypothetical protein QM640_11555 [Niabella sp.]
MKSYIHIFSLLFILILVNCSAKTQNNSFAGYYDGSKMELVFNLYILPNHEFVIKIIYGSEDRLITGSWKEAGANEIILQENRQQADPYVVYTSNGTAQQRSLNFKYFDQNTETALGFGEPFQASKLKYILKPDENYFSYQYSMKTSRENSKVIYLSRALSDFTHEVYVFAPKDDVQNIVIMYNALTDKPVFNAKASMKDGELYLSYEQGKKEYVGKKQNLPADIEKQLGEMRNYNTIPEIRKIKIEDEVLTFKRISPKQNFKVDVSIDPEQSYFGNDNQANEADEIPVPVAPAALKH